MAQLFPGTPLVQPLGLVGETLQPVPEVIPQEKTIDPLAREKVDAATDAAFASFADAPANFDQFQNAPAAPDAFAGFKTADDLDVKSVDELNADRTNFNPVTYFQSNPDAASDPTKLQKLLDVYRKRREEGLDAGEVIKAAVKETPALVANIGGGIKRLGERAIDVTVQPIANVVLGALTGDLFDEQKRNALFNETRKVIKKGTAETAAGSEAAAVGLVDLTRQGLRKIETESHKPEGFKLYPPRPLGPGERPGLYAKKPIKPLTDQELLRDISDDVAFRQNAAEILTGQGEAAKKIGLDKETLAKQGIELDEKAIEQLSLVDPISMVAAGGAFKLVGLGGKVLGTARTLEGAKLIVEKLAGIAKIRTAKIVGGAVEKVGKVAAETAGFSGRGLTSAGALVGGLGGGPAGGVQGAIVTKLATKTADVLLLPTINKAGAVAEQAGRILAGKAPTGVASATAQKIIDYAAIPGRAVTSAAGEITKGAFTGIAAAAPFAVMADEDAQAGALLGAGAALGAGTGALQVGEGAFRVVKQGVSRRYFGENRPVLEDVASPAYGKDAALDAQHEANIQKLSVQDSSELKNFREALRQQGGEIYAVDAPTWRQKLTEAFPNATPEQLDIYQNHSAFFDVAQGPDRQVVYLNADTAGTGGLKHDAGHIFDAVIAPAKRAELRAAVKDAFPQKAIDEFQATYERRVGNKISEAAALDEFIAEQFAALFNNVPVTELNAPKSLLNKFVDAVAEEAEAFGIDLSAGATTPNLGAPVSVGIRRLFRNAAGEVTRANIEGVPATNVVSPDFGGTPPSPAAPAGPSSAVPPTNIVPLTPPPPTPPPTPAPAPAPTPTPAKPIRTIPETPKTPEARAAAAKRFEATGIGPAKELAATLADPVGIKAVDEISAQMQSGNPVLEVEHLGIKSKGVPETPEGRTSRRTTQAAAYEVLKGELSRAGAPADLVAKHIKTFVPVRWEPQGGSPTLIAMSLDKVLTNLKEIAKNPKAKDLIPYPTETVIDPATKESSNRFTEQGWRDSVSDFQKYAENQANGRKGDGGRLTVPEAGELSIPVENPSYTPQPLSPEKSDFMNLMQGLETPGSSKPGSKETKFPTNIKGQLLAEANNRPVELPVNIPAKKTGSQAYVKFPGRVVQEVNPLRNRMKAAGVDVGDLHKVTERIRAQDIEKVTPRPDLNFKAPVTDIIQGGFLPAPTEFRQKSLQGRTVEEFSEYVLKSTPEEWSAATGNMTGGLTGGAWNLGLGLKDAADVGVLKSYAGKFSESAKAAMMAGEFDLAMSQVSRGQFFREAYEAATGTGSAGAAFKRGTAGMESAKVPFPAETTTAGTTSAAGPGTTTEAAKFLPAEELAPVAAEPTTPELRVVPAARPPRPLPPGARPPIIPPPVAAKEESEQPANFLPAPDKKIQDLAKTYTEDAGLPYAPKGGYAEVKPDLAKKLAEFYDKAVSDPTNPEVASSYEALIRETEEQGKAILAAGYKIEPWTGAGEPYKNSAEAIADVRNNKHLFFRKTEGAFGSGESSAGNPMLRESALVPGQVANDVFRWVHDFFGHSKEGFQFGPRGEFNAWRAHSEMYSPEAQGALAAETLAQNSWVNYGSHLEGKIIPIAERPFAEQKNIVIPKELINEATFAPRTDAGRALEERGYEIVPSGELGTRRVTIVTPSGVEIASIQSVQRSPKNAEIAMVQKAKGAPKGLGEVLYREVGAQLKEDGVTKVTGQVVSPEPLAIRKKIFGGFASLDINGEPATYEQALATAERLQQTVGAGNEVAAIEPVNKITAATRFAPGEQPDMNFIRQGDAAIKVRDLERERNRIISELKTVQDKDRDALVARLAQVSRDAETAWHDFSQTRAGFAPGPKRDAQGRPLNKDGEIDYAKWQKEGLAARKKQRAESDKAEPLAEVGPKVDETEPTKATGWILPNRKFIPLDTNFHEQYLAENAADLNQRFGTEFKAESTTDDRLAALNAGFVRLRNYNGRLSVEANAQRWSSVKSKVLSTLQDLEGQLDSLTVSLLNDKGQQVDSTSAGRLFEMSRPDKMNAIEEAVSTVRATGPRFLPGDGLPGFEDISVEQAGRLKAKRRIAAVKKNNPEAVTPQYARDEAGEIIVTPDGNPKPLTLDYDLINSPVAKEAAKGLKGAAREEAAAEAIGNKLVDFYKEAEKNPDLKAGSKWYSTARTRLRGVFGDDSKFFAELLGATSARTPVATNYRFALDAYNQFKAGAYDKTLAKYREGKAAWESGDVGDFKGETRGQFMDFWVRKHDLGVTQSSGKKFGMNSRAVLRVLDGSWASDVKGPKTPNFAGNLTGETYESTVDVWAARTLHRLANEGGKDRWRILPENETGVTDQDFYFGQAAYRDAAKKIGIKPDALQAVLWFAEKKHWEDRGWTRGAGAALSDFNILLKETEKTPSGMKMKTPQQEFGLDTGASIGDIVKKKR